MGTISFVKKTLIVSLKNCIFYLFYPRFIQAFDYQFITRMWFKTFSGFLRYAQMWDLSLVVEARGPHDVPA